MSPDDRCRAVIEREIKARGLTRSALANKAGIGETSLRDYMKKKARSITIEQLERIAQALDMMLGDFVGPQLSLQDHYFLEKYRSASIEIREAANAVLGVTARTVEQARLGDVSATPQAIEELHSSAQIARPSPVSPPQDRSSGAVVPLARRGRRPNEET